jgi:hypothetical protein
MKRIILVLNFCLLFTFSKGQTKYDLHWLCGALGSQTHFDTPIPTTNGYIFTNATYYTFGHSNICNKDGELVLVSNGFSIQDKNGELIDNGDSITPKEIIKKQNGFSHYSQSSLFLPFPNNKYYLFTPTASDNEVNTYWKNSSLGRALYDELLFHVIDMNAIGGKGKVVQKGIPLLQNVLLSKTNMMACKHGNGGEWWLLKQAHDTNMVYKFLVKEDGVYNMGTQGFAEPHFGKWDVFGQAMFSQDGSQYAVCIRGGGEQTQINPPPVTPGKIFVADFNRCDGILSNPRVYQTKPNQYINPFDTSTLFENYNNGMCFSPNGRFLYVSTDYSIKQLDLLDPDTNTQWTKIADLDTTWLAFQNYGPLYLGPDHKLYIGNRNGLSKQMSVINNPNAKGAACQFCPRCLRFPDVNISSPPCMPNYHLGAWVGGPCSPLQINNDENEKAYKLYPNPSNGKIQIQSIANYELRITDLQVLNLQGQVLLEEKNKSEIDISAQPQGIYFLRITNEANEKYVYKVVRE